MTSRQNILHLFDLLLLLLLFLFFIQHLLNQVYPAIHKRYHPNYRTEAVLDGLKNISELHK